MQFLADSIKKVKRQMKAEGGAPEANSPPSASSSRGGMGERQMQEQEQLQLVDVVFPDDGQPLGVNLGSNEGGCSAFVLGFSRSEEGAPLTAELDGRIRVGDAVGWVQGRQGR
jgi:hypothetical protein